MGEEDLFNELEQEQAKPTQEVVAPKFEKKEFKKKENPWEMRFTEESLDLTNMIKMDRTFTAFTHYMKEGVDDATILRVKEIAKALTDRGFRFRSIGDKKDKCAEAVLRVDNVMTEFYLPFKKYNEENSISAIMNKPTEKAFRVAMKYVDNANTKNTFNDRVPAIGRAVTAASFHALFGKELNNPVKVLILCKKIYDKPMPDELKQKYFDLTEAKVQATKDAGGLVINVLEDNYKTKLDEFLNKN